MNVRSRRTRRLVKRAVPLASLVGSVAACGGSTEPAVDSSEASGTCPTAPTLTPLPALSPRESRLAASVRFPLEALEDALNQEVPKVLANEKNQAIGTPGRVTYKVERGPLSVHLNEGDIAITTQLNSRITVCKPFGSFCPQYGQCTPNWNVSVRVPTALDLNSPPEVTLDVKISKGCVLRPVGLNVTPQLEEITEKQVKQVRRRVQREAKAAHRRLQRTLEQPLPSSPVEDYTIQSPQTTSTKNGTRSCVSFLPSALDYTVTEERKDLVLTTLLTGSVVRHACEEPLRADPNLAVRRAAVDDPQTALTVDQRLAWDDLQAALNDALGSPVEVLRGLDPEGHAQLWASLPDARCGQDFVPILPVATGNALRLERNTALSPGALDARIGALVWTAAPGAWTTPENALEILNAQLEKSLESTTLEPRPSLHSWSPRVTTEVELTTEGVAVQTTLQGDALRIQ